MESWDIKKEKAKSFPLMIKILYTETPIFTLILGFLIVCVEEQFFLLQERTSQRANIGV